MENEYSTEVQAILAVDAQLREVRSALSVSLHQEPTQYHAIWTARELRDSLSCKRMALRSKLDRAQEFELQTAVWGR